MKGDIFMSDQIARLILENVQPRPGRGSWHGGPTAVGALRGVSAEQAAWTPEPGRKSIWQLALHIAYWKYAVRRRLEGGSESRFARTPANWPRVPSPADARAWFQDVALLKQEHELLVDVIAAVPLRRYDVPLPQGKQWTTGEMILGIAQHDAYHTGQIQLLKKLWSAKPAAHRGESGA